MSESTTATVHALLDRLRVMTAERDEARRIAMETERECIAQRDQISDLKHALLIASGDVSQ
jgi:hypothetical protein